MYCNPVLVIPGTARPGWKGLPRTLEKTTVRDHMSDIMDFRIFIVEDESIVAQDLEESLKGWDMASPGPPERASLP